MPKTRLLDVNAAGGGYLSVAASIPGRRVEVVEDEVVTPQGLNYKLPDDNFVQVYNVSPGAEPIVLGNVIAHGNAVGAVLGYPEQNLANGVNAPNYRAADTLIKLESRTAVATKVRVTEFE